MNNLTDAEIEKALECCSNWQSDKSCEECPENTYSFGCAQKMAKHAFDYIKRLRKEKEKYEHIQKTINMFWSTLLELKIANRKENPTIEEFAEAIEEIRAEVIREFAEKLKKISRIYLNRKEMLTHAVSLEDIDNLVKEMTEKE